MYSALRRFSTSAATRRSAWRGLPPRFTATPEVLSALKNGEPVVALESTIISHGMPFPDNLRTAQAVEKAVRDAGSIPATIAILDGEVHVGLSADNLARFAETPRNQVTKTSRRDFAAVMADRNRMGATTVASTVMAAHRAGISLFATGGIGGVHRGGESTMDVSADLTELGRSPVAVVCAGVKSILDIGRTLEYLETQGVTVATLGETDDFPAFFVPKSGFRSPYQIKSAVEAAEIVRANRDLNAQSGMVFAVPIPADQAADAALIEKAIQQAIQEMDEQGVAGRDATPFILGRVAQLTGGSSLAANIALVVNNARVGGEIARKVAELDHAAAALAATGPHLAHIPLGRPMVVGGCAIDITASITQSKGHSLHGTTHPGTVESALGGVGLNIARTLARLSSPETAPSLVSAVGSDSHANQVISGVQQSGILTTDGTLTRLPNERTAVVSLILGADGQLVSGVADMGISERISPAHIERSIIQAKPSVVCIDSNLSVDAIAAAIQAARQVNAPTVVEPTSVPKSARVVRAVAQTMQKTSGKETLVGVTTPNAIELAAMAKEVKSNAALGLTAKADGLPIIETLATAKSLNIADIVENAAVCASMVQVQVITLGEHGVVVVDSSSSLSSSSNSAGSHKIVYKLADGTEFARSISFKHFPALSLPQLVSSTGAGDAFAATLVAQISKHGGIANTMRHIDEVINKCQRVAITALGTKETVASSLGPHHIN